MVEPEGVGSPSRWADGSAGPPRFTARFLFGVALLALGALWTMDNLGLTDASEITRWWPLLLVVFGVAKVLGWGTRRSTYAGAMWLLAGGWLLLHALGIVQSGLAGLGSLALILIGVRILLYPGRSRARLRMERVSTQSVDENGRLKMDVVMSNAQRRVEHGPFPGGEVNAVLATATLDLRGATLADGRVELEVNAVLGGIELYVPGDWRVASAVTAVLGNVEDHTEKLPDGAASRGTLYLRGNVVMGSIEIRD
jgi:hypothetical protein